jgi:cation/acetate symporter
MRIQKDQQQREEGEEMSSEMYERIRTNPRYKEEMAKRSRFSWTLAAIVLVIFYGFILVVAFAPELLATPLGEGWTTTIGIPIGVGIITLFWLLTGYYVYRANKEFDVTNVQILRESEK